MKLTKTKLPYVVYINRTKLIWAGDSLKNIQPVEFAPDVFVDLEFPNIRNFDNQILTMVEQYNLKPFQVVIVLSSDLYYSQQFASQAEDEMKSYLSLIPFDEVISKRFQNSTGQQLIAVSNDFVEPLIEVFKHYGFEVLAMIPDFALGESLKTEEQFTPEIATQVLKSMDALLPYSFYLPPRPQENMTSIRDSEGKIFSPRLILMIIFFIALIGILVLVLYMNGYIGAKKTPPIISNVPTQTVTEKVLEPTPTVEPVASSEAQVASNSAESADVSIQPNLSIEILNGSGVVGQADEIKSVLTKAGFKKFKTGNSTATSQKTLVLYTTKVSSNSLEAVISSIKEFDTQVSSQESPELSDVDMRIITGKK